MCWIKVEVKLDDKKNEFTHIYVRIFLHSKKYFDEMIFVCIILSKILLNA